jgi:glycosyltransferase involved in cell wall biosynthesis
VRDDHHFTGPTGAAGARPLAGLTVGRFGHFDPGYSRNRIVAKALERAGASVVDVADRRRFPHRTPALIRGGLATDVDLLLVSFPGHSDIATAKLVAGRRRAPILFDALVSLWETNVVDRATVRARSLQGLRYRLTDAVACALADAVLLDTDAHVAWFAERFGIPPRKLHRLWVGADEDLVGPCPPREPGMPFTVFFYGSFIPLQGIEHIVGAAERLQSRAEVRFVLCGDGQTHAAMRALAQSRGVSNLEFVGRRSLRDLYALMCDSDVCLGIFGIGPKARAVIPNKVFDALASARPLITGDTPAVREALTHGEDAWLCPPGDPDALADAIARLEAEPATRARLAAAGRNLFERRFSLDALATDLARIVRAVVDGRP